MLRGVFSGYHNCRNIFETRSFDGDKIYHTQKLSMVIIFRTSIIESDI